LPPFYTWQAFAMLGDVQPGTFENLLASAPVVALKD